MAELKKNQYESGPIFIVGMPRSGTTLVSNLLSRHSLIFISPETHFVAHDWRINKNLDLSVRENRDLVIDGFVSGPWFEALDMERRDLDSRFRGDKKTTFQAIFEFVLATQAQRVEKTIFGEKTPGHYEHIDILLRWFPNSKVIFMIRDPRAVVASTIVTPFGTRFANFHARRWKRANHCWKLFRSDARVLLLKYEQLVENPINKVEELCRFIGVAPEARMLASPSEEPQMHQKSWRKSHHARAEQPIDGRSVSKWQTGLRPGQLRIIEYLCQEGMRQHQYPLATDAFSFLDKITAYVSILYSRLVMGFQRHFRALTGHS